MSRISKSVFAAVLYILLFLVFALYERKNERQENDKYRSAEG